MAEKFDPYYTWLGIPPQEQPPHFYRLLGLEVFEENREVICDCRQPTVGISPGTR